MSTEKYSSISELTRLCRTGDNKAWNELVLRITPLIFSICGRMGLSQDESFDIFGQVMYLLLKNLHKIKSSDKLLSYVSTMTRREVFALGKKAKLHRRLEGFIIDEASVQSSKTPDDLFEDSVMSELLMEAVAKLPKRENTLIHALFFDSDCPSYEQIAKRLKIPVSSIGPYRARCFKKLQKVLKKKL